MAVLSFDGPGQGEVWSVMKMRLDYETAVTAVVDYLANRNDIDINRIGMIGHSMGGHFGARAAAFEHRLSAAVLIAGFFELRPWEDMSVFLRAGLMHISGAQNETEARQYARQLSLDDIGEKIQCPLLIVHGGKDKLLPLTEAYRLEASTTCPTELLIFPEGNHSGNNIVYKVEPTVADWLMDRLTK